MWSIFMLLLEGQISNRIESIFLLIANPFRFHDTNYIWSIFGLVVNIIFNNCMSRRVRSTFTKHTTFLWSSSIHAKKILVYWMARKSLLCVRKFPLVSRKCCCLAPWSFVLSLCTEKGGKFGLKGIRPDIENVRTTT